MQKTATRTEIMNHAQSRQGSMSGSHTSNEHHEDGITVFYAPRIQDRPQRSTFAEEVT